MSEISIKNEAVLIGESVFDFIDKPLISYFFVDYLTLWPIIEILKLAEIARLAKFRRIAKLPKLPKLPKFPNIPKPPLPDYPKMPELPELPELPEDQTFSVDVCHIFQLQLLMQTHVDDGRVAKIIKHWFKES